jgi:hypothetical protein
VHDRSLKVATVIESLEMEMELLCLTGVEDQLQADVRPTLEILRNAGIKVRGGHRGRGRQQHLAVHFNTLYLSLGFMPSVTVVMSLFECG